MAKGKNKLNKTNSSGWLDDYSEELSISKYANGDRVIDPLLSPGQLAQLNKLKELSKKLPKDEEILLKQMQNKRAQDKLSVSKEKTTADKLKKLVREPVTTLADQAEYNNFDLLFGIPGRVGTGIYSTVGNLLTPSTYPTLGKGAVNLVSNALTDENVYEGVNEDASRILGEGLDILDIMDMGVALKSLPYLNKNVSNLAQSGLSSLRNRLVAARYPDKADFMYRGLNEEGFRDAIESKFFRSKPNPAPNIVENTSLNLRKTFPESTPYFTPNFSTAQSYGSDYIAKVPKDVANWTQRYKKSDWSQYADNTIPIDKGEILKKHWLLGYKPVKFESGGEFNNLNFRDFFSNGGKVQPYITNNPNDPRLKKYQDSLALFNASNMGRVNSLLKQGYKYDTKGSVKNNRELTPSQKKQYQKAMGVNPNKFLQNIIQDGNDGIKDNRVGGKKDLKKQAELMHGQIAPIEMADLFDSLWRNSEYLKGDLKNPMPGYDKTDKTYRKNPNYGKPLAKDKEGEVIRNFFSVPIYKKPVQPVILNIGDNSTINTTKGKVSGKVAPNDVKGSKLIQVRKEIKPENTNFNVNANGEFSTPEDYVESVVEQMPIQQTPDFRKYLQPKGFSRQGQSGERQGESFYDANGKMTGQIINGQYAPTEYGKFLESGMSEDEYLNQVQEFAYGGKINNDMKKKLKKYPAGGYLDYQEGYKGFGVGPQLYQDNSYFRSIMPSNIENMEEEINKPSVFSGINNILGGIDQIASKGIGLAGNFMKSKMPGAMGNMEGYEGLSGDAKKSFDFNKLLNFAEGKTGSNLIDTDLESIAGRISGGMSGDGQVFGGLLGGGGNKGILQGMSLLGQKNGGYLKQYQNGGMMDMLPVGSPEYIHKSNVFHENYNPVPRVHFTDDTTPYDMGVNLNDLVNMNGGRINKYQNGGSMDLQGYFNYLTNQNQNRVPSRAFNANTNRASLGALEAANANDFLNTKVRNDRQAFEDDKVDWGFMDWSKDIAAGGLGLLSSVPVLGDTVKDVVGDSFLTRRDGYSVGKGVGNVGMGAAKLVAGIPKGDVSMIMGGIGDIGEGVGSTVGNLNAKSAMRDYNKSGYVSGKRLANAATDFNTTMGLSSKLYGIGSSAVGLAKNPSNKSLNTFLSNQTPFNRANKGQNDLNFLLGQFMPGLNGGGDTGGEMAMGGYLNNYQEGGMVSMPEDFEIPKFKKGGLTPKKAREILHDKSVHGNPLTDKQRKYFGYISSQKKSSGGWLDEL